MITAAETMIEQGRKEGLEKGREIGFEIGRVQGLEMGREEGRVQGQTSLLVKLLTLKFGPISPSHQALISNATLEQLELYATRVLFADTISSVFED